MPAAQTWPSAMASCNRPSSSRLASATFTALSSCGNVARAKLVSTLPAPTWRKIRAPSADAERSAETKSSGADACCTQISRASPAYGLAVIALTTGNAPGATAIFATSSPMVCAIPAISGE